MKLLIDRDQSVYTIHVHFNTIYHTRVLHESTQVLDSISIH